MAKVLSEQEFSAEVLESKGTVLVDFFAPWCGPCKMLSPVVDQVAEEVADKGSVFKVNVDEAANIAAQFGVMSIPTLVVFKDGEEVQRFTGVQPKGALLDLFA